MSSASSAVTYTSVYTDSEPGRAFWGADDEEISEGGIPRAHDPDYVPEPIYPEYIPLEDKHEFPTKEQPLPPSASEEDPEEYEDDETEDGPDEDKEEEHLALADSDVVVPTDEPISPPEGTELVIPPPSTDITIGARISVRPQTVNIPFTRGRGERLVRCMAPPALSSPHLCHHPLTTTIWACPTHNPDTQESIHSGHLLIQVIFKLPSPLLHHYHHLDIHCIPLFDLLDDIPESEQPPHKRLCLSTLGSKYEIGESSTARPTRGRGIDYYSELHLDRHGRGLGIPHESIWTRGVNYLMGDKMSLHETATHQELQTHRDHVYATRDPSPGTSDTATAAGHQAQMVETLRVMRDMRREMGNMQTELLALRGQRRARQPAPDARIPDHQDASGDADNHV
ncbi:hypothetical protein Tco_0919711 [Tanacetum coccineum]